MFGIGPQELLIIGLLFLIIFGPAKLPSMARDFSRFVAGVNRTVDEFKSELESDDLEEVRHAVEEIKGELEPEDFEELQRSIEEMRGKVVEPEDLEALRRAVEETKSERASSPDEGEGEEPASSPPSR